MALALRVTGFPKEFFTPIPPKDASSLGMALVMSSATPLVLLSDTLIVQAASGSFCRAFSLDCNKVVGRELFELGNGEWNVPQLRSLLNATAAGHAAIEAYEMAFTRAGMTPQTLVLNAHVLDHPDSEPLRLVLAITDVTETRASERRVRHAELEKEALLREKEVLLQELHHRVANSLQIIASVLMQRVRSVQSEETREHLRDAHHRVMSIATLQRQLAATATGDVYLKPYLSDLCASIGASMIADPAELTLEVVVDDSFTSADRSVSIGLIVTELVINALKHAFPGGPKKGKITVGFAANPQGWLLFVGDNGVGLPGNFAQAKPGLGTGIVNALATQLSSTVTIANANPGTLVSVTHVDAEPVADLKPV